MPTLMHVDGSLYLYYIIRSGLYANQYYSLHRKPSVHVYLQHTETPLYKALYWPI
jgi:hypothetical protein